MLIKRQQANRPKDLEAIRPLIFTYREGKTRKNSSFHINRWTGNGEERRASDFPRP